MPIIVAPSTQPVPNGYTVPRNELVTVVLNTGDTLRWGVSNSQSGGAGSTHEFGFYAYQDGTNRLIWTMAPDWGAGAFQTEYVATAPIGLVLTLQIGGNATNAPTGTAFGVFVELIPASAVNCAYGTKRRSSANAVLILTPELILTWLTSLGMSWLGVGLAFLYYSTLDVDELCRAGPPPLPEIDESTLAASAATWTQILRAIAWANLCECVPGTPAPIPYPPPAETRPPQWPDSPVFECSEVDLCSAIVAIRQQLAALSSRMATVVDLATAMQRWNVPFAYIRGARHQGLVGTGAFAVPRCVGFLIEVTSWPDGLQTFSGVPAYISDLGWVSTLSDDGYVEQIRLTRQAYAWLPTQPQLARSLGYALRDGVTADVTELYAEP